MENTSERGANVGQMERWASGLVGGALALRGIGSFSTGRLLGLATGVGLLYRGLTGHCPVYERLGIDTAGQAAGGAPSEQQVDQTLEDTFPASDAPAWTPTTSVGSIR
jgi:uncharacterized membrane protein